MKHFTDEAWIDFARQILSPGNMKLMRAHLEGGCETCRNRCHIWQTVATIISSELQHDPPEPVVRLAKAMYAAKRRTYILPKLAKMIPAVFDTFRTSTATAGVRSLSAAPRHILHRIGSWTIDLRLQNLGGGRMFVAGQVIRSGRKRAEASGADVVLMRGDTRVAQASTNEFGEFLLECEQDTNLRIYVALPGSQPVGMALPDPNT
jgi:hypothetical protein